jgi:hypothetical protein
MATATTKKCCFIVLFVFAKIIPKIAAGIMVVAGN